MKLANDRNKKGEKTPPPQLHPSKYIRCRGEFFNSDKPETPPDAELRIRKNYSEVNLWKNEQPQFFLIRNHFVNTWTEAKHVKVNLSRWHRCPRTGSRGGRRGHAGEWSQNVLAKKIHCYSRAFKAIWCNLLSDKCSTCFRAFLQVKIINFILWFHYYHYVQ